jgi:dipeptidyl aminopeptidase/acylaminoacyl peptidase
LTVDAGPPLIGSGIVWLDERWLVASMLDRSSAPLQLWLLSYPDGKLQRLSNDLNQYVGISLTGRRDALVTVRGEFTFGIWTSDASATTWSQVVADTPMKGPIGFGVEWIGEDLLYVASTASGFGLMRWNAATRAAQMIAPSAGYPTVNGDGSTIAAFDYDAGELFTIDGSGGNRVLVSGGFGPLRRLMPDGKHLVGIVMQPSPTVQLQPVDTKGTSRVIASDRVRNGVAEVSPDGQWLAYSAVDANNRPAVIVCDVAICSSKRTLPPVSTWHWTPDSQALAYVGAGGSADLWIQPVTGGPPRQLTHFPSDRRQIADFAWSADGKRLAVARASASNDIVIFRGFRGAAEP